MPHEDDEETKSAAGSRATDGSRTASRSCAIPPGFDQRRLFASIERGVAAHFSSKQDTKPAVERATGGSIRTSADSFIPRGTLDQRQVCAFGVDPRDDLEAASEWMKKGRVDSTGLAKQLPYTAQALREGRVDPRHLATGLGALYEFPESFGMDQLEQIAVYLSDKTIPPQSWFDKVHVEHSRVAMCGEFSSDLLKNVKEIMRSDGQQHDEEHITLSKDQMVKSYEKGFTRTCSEWADRIDREVLPTTASGCFLRSCPLFLPGAFEHTLNSILEHSDDLEVRKERDYTEYMKTELLRAAEGVARGLHKAQSACWACGSSAKTMRCSKCKVATYCCQECQATAWKQGHKKKCKPLKSKYESFTKSLAAVDDVHEKGPTLEGIQLSDVCEYQLVRMISSFSKDLFDGMLPGPSMEVFYENLGRVARGEWWFFPETEGFADYQARITGDETEYQQTLSQLLAYDYFGYVATKFDIVDDPGFVANHFMSEWEVLKEILSTYGAAMSAERFIFNYNGGYHVSSNPTDRSRVRRQCKADFVDYLRTHHHKW